VTVIAEMLGVDPERHADFKRWSDAIVTASTGAGPMSMSRGPEMIELLSYLAQVIEQRRKAPRDDLISTLLRAEEGEALKPVEVVIFTLLLLVAGNETTTNLLGNIVLALCENPAELARVQSDPTLVPALVEEGLRYEPPAQAIFRETRHDLALGGVSIPKGEIVVPLLGSANRDEEVFPGGDRFEVRRDRPNHVGFGFGQHFCLGASLARLEARVALEELLQLRGIARKPGSDYERLDSFMLRGLRSLPLVFET
jgi:cytochrome P450